MIHFQDGSKYVGRARNMQKRVNSHFNKRGKFKGDATNVTRVDTYVRRQAMATRRTEQFYIDKFGGPQGGILRNKRNEWLL